MSLNWDSDNCPFCQKQLSSPPSTSVYSGHCELTHYFCESCGRFAITDYYFFNRYIGDKYHPTSEDMNAEEEARFKISCFLAENKLKKSPAPIRLSATSSIGIISYEQALDSFPRTAIDIYNRALLNIGQCCTTPVSQFILNDNNARALFVKNLQEAAILLHFMKEMGYITFESSGSTRITPKGWQKVEELQQINKESRQCFVAMAFKGNYQERFENAIKPAIEGTDSQTGFQAFKIDNKEHNDKICDQIIAEIKRSRFVVADVTFANQGAYFEAGFAMGLGIPIIWIVDKNWCDEEMEIYKKQIKNGEEPPIPPVMHFDTRQYNHIFYSSLEDLREKLHQRIRATM